MSKKDFVKWLEQFPDDAEIVPLWCNDGTADISVRTPDNEWHDWPMAAQS